MGLLHRLRGDESLMELYAGGDVGAFNELYSRHKDRLFGFIYHSSSDRTAAEDLAQETWSAVIRQADSYRPTARFTTYLYTIARRKLIDQHRRSATRPVADADSDETPAATGSEPDTHLEVAQLRAAIKALPADQREAFVLREEGFSLTDIAAISDAGVETVKSRLRYARQTLRQQFSGGHRQHA